MCHGNADDPPASDKQAEETARNVLAVLGRLTPLERQVAGILLRGPDMFGVSKTEFDALQRALLALQADPNRASPEDWEAFRRGCREYFKKASPPECEDPAPSGAGGTAPELPAPQPGIIYVYALTQPDTGEVAYIGRTNHPRSRWITHCRTKDHWRAVGRWLISLREQGLRPGISILEAVPDSAWQDAERRWIAYYRAQGVRLVNGTAGGNGNRGGHQFSESHRQHISESRKGKTYSEEGLKNLRAAASARSARYREAGIARHHTPEARAKMTERIREAALRNYPITIGGVSKIVSQWAADAGLSTQTVRNRLRNGWDPAQAVSTPPRGRPRQVKPETCAKISAAQRGRPGKKGWTHGEAAREKISAANLKKRGRIWEGFRRPDGSPVSAFTNLTAFAKEHSLGIQAMHRLYHGKLGCYKGWTCDRGDALPAKDSALTDEARQKLREAALARHARKRAALTEGEKPSVARNDWPPLISPEGSQVEVVGSLRSFCLVRGLCYSSIHRLCLGKYKSYKGYTCPRPVDAPAAAPIMTAGGKP